MGPSLKRGQPIVWFVLSFVSVLSCRPMRHRACVLVGSHPMMQLAIGALGRAQADSPGNPLEWQGRFFSQPGCQCQFRSLLEPRLLARFRQRPEKIVPVHILQKNALAPVATAHHMVNGTSIFHSHFARHANKTTAAFHEMQAK